MNKSELQRLIKIEDRIYQIAKDDGLDFCDIEFDVIPDQKMLEIMSYRIPGNISNWKYGRDYEKLKTFQEKVYYSLPLEVVINSNPARAYLMKNNTFALQVLVMAHVVGHVAFFTMSKHFQRTKRDMINYLSVASERFNKYERLYGIDEVEKIIDAGHSIQFHCNPFDLETEDEKIKRIFEQMKLKKHVKSKAEFADITAIDDYDSNKEQDIYLENQNLWRKLKNKTPVEPTEDLLRYIIDNSEILDDWQKDILEVLKQEGEYFWPQMRTPYMNEGFACIVGDSLVHTENGFVPIKQAIEYCNKVIGINNKLTNIEERYVTKKIPTIKIKTNIGIELEGAELHRILIDKTDKKEDIYLKDLKVGDEPSISVGNNIWPNDIVKINIDSCLQRQQFSKTQEVKIPDVVNPDISYLMGSLTAEGCNLGRGFMFTNQDNEYLNIIQEIVKFQFDKEVEILPRKDSDTKDIRVYSTPIIDFLYQAGFSNTKSNKKEIPWSILQSPKNIVSHFIAGFFDGDGCVYYNGKSARQIIFTSKSEKLIKQFSIILLNYGIIGSFRLNKKEGYDDCYQLVISKGKCLKIFYEEIPFKNNKKRLLLYEAIKSIKFTRPIKNTCKIISIEKSESVNYDWSIPEGKHYVAQGFINHNTLTHERIMKQLFKEELLTISDHAQFNYSNSLVKAMNPKSMNPYLVGSKIWEDVINRWDKGLHGREYENCENTKEKENWDDGSMMGREKMFEIVRSHTDWFFMQNFLTPKLIDELQLYVYVKKDRMFTEDYIITKQESKKIAKMIIMSFAHSNIPKIEIMNGNFKNKGYLFLKHDWAGVGLEPKYCSETLKHIYNLWGKAIFIKTKRNKDEEIIYELRKK